ncbi:MAG: hypothetical protein ACREL9_01040 [Gemmatimonadales bacterium]
MLTLVLASQPAEARSTADSCHVDQRAAPVEIPLGSDLLSGEYRLTVVADHGFVGDTVAIGRLTMSSTGSELRTSHNKSITFPAWGWSDIDLLSLGPVTLAYGPSSRDPARPGVQAVYDSDDRSLVLVFGNAFERVGVTEDAGVFFHVHHLDGQVMRGRWEDGGLRTPRPGGYFCASRVTAPRNGEQSR